jgi:glycosyltransferase involved in cell wall biosynthesis
VPWFRALAAIEDIDFSVLFISHLDAQQQGRGFGLAFEWDIPLLDGYRSRQAPGLRRGPGRKGFFSKRLGDPRAVLREMEPDVLVLTGWHMWPLVQLLIAAWRLGIPVVMRGESNALRQRPPVAQFLHRSILRRCAAFLPIGRASRDFYRGYGIAEPLLFDTPYFVENARFRASAERAMPGREQLRARWGIPPAAVCYCYAGKLEPKKRILDLLGALHVAVSRSVRPVHLLVIGSGELQREAEAMVAQLKLPVSFAGFLNQTEIPSAYAAADCLVLPSDYGETWGLVVNEAMACGRPAIVSDRVGCAPDLVSDGVTGAVFPFGDIPALADRLVELADPERLRTMGERARERVMQGYSVERSVAGTLEAIRFVLAPS